MNKPNILIIMSDEQRYDTLGCTGSGVAQTPHIDALARQGVVVDQCYTPFPLCCPSRASLWTSMMPHNHHVIGNWRSIRPELRDGGAVADYASAGYHTAYSGKWHVPGTTPERLGFCDASAIPAVLDGKDRGRYIERYREYAESRGYRLDPRSIENLTEKDLTDLQDPSRAPCGTSEIALEHYIETWQTDQFLQALDSRPRDMPFFAVVSYSAPHFPMVVPEPYDRLISPDDVELPSNFCAPLDGAPAEIAASHYFQDYKSLSEYEWRRLISHYYGFCSLVDTQVGKIVQYLNRQGVLEQTIVVYTSDHGDMIGSHGLFQKGHPLHFEEITHVPLVIRYPDAVRSSRISGFVSLIDLLPTLAELSGVRLSRELDGESFAGSLEGGFEAGIRDHVVAETFLVDGAPGGGGEYVDPEVNIARITANLSIRTDTDKYVLHMTDIDEYYDLTRDPHEMRNAIDDSSSAPRIADLRDTLLAEIGVGCPPLAQAARVAP